MASEIERNRVRDAIHRAVFDAIDSGVSASDFRSMVVVAWDEEMRQKARADIAELRQ